MNNVNHLMTFQRIPLKNWFWKKTRVINNTILISGWTVVWQESRSLKAASGLAALNQRWLLKGFHLWFCCPVSGFGRWLSWPTNAADPEPAVCLRAQHGPAMGTDTSLFPPRLHFLLCYWRVPNRSYVLPFFTLLFFSSSRFRVYFTSFPMILPFMWTLK